MSKEMSYKANLSWISEGRAFTYKDYSRTYIVRVEGKPDLVGTAATEFLGSPYHLNPEDMLVASLSACHMLTYLAFASNSKITVLSYDDAAEGFLHQVDKTYKFREVVLKPKIKVPAGTDLAKAKELHDKAHHGCFIANSVNFPVKVEPEFIAE